jgi:uncharacterized membrane protein
MIEFENIIEIKRPVEDVFSFVSNFEHNPKWNYYVLEVKKTTAGPAQAGATFYQTRRADSQFFTITEYEPGKRVTIQTMTDSRPAFEMSFSFQSVDDGTRITDKWKLELGLPLFIEKLAKWKVKKAVKQNLVKLKELLENGRVQLQDGRSVKI